MTKDQFFQMPAEQRRALIKGASYYYSATDFNENLNKITDPEVKDFIEMLITERNQAASTESFLGVN
jgi:hypothetical protein